MALGSIDLGSIDRDSGWGEAKAPDLIWPLEQFSPALDTDFLALLTTPDSPDASDLTQEPPISALLHQFMTCLWQMTTPLTESC
jgi:hypothetical protein